MLSIQPILFNLVWPLVVIHLMPKALLQTAQERSMYLLPFFLNIHAPLQKRSASMVLSLVVITN